MPNRIIKESICESDGLSQCSFFAKELYTRLITYADDYGRFNADTQIMAARLYPRELDCVTQEDVNEALIELAGVGKIAFYTSKPHKTIYGCFPNWREHQRVRDSKQKCPDPDDTNVNDWYLQRFIPMDMKIEIVELSGFKCQICGKFITSDKNAKRLVKRGCGMYHIDHIVPVAQGGRATLENLRLTCPSCNLTRKKRYSFKEIVDFSLENRSCGELRRVAASCGELRPESNPNPIRIQSESRARRASAPAHTRENADVSAKETCGEFANVFLSQEEWDLLVDKYGKSVAEGLIDNFSRKLKAKGYEYEDHYATILDWANQDGVKPRGEKSYDTEDFYNAALTRSYEHLQGD